MSFTPKEADLAPIRGRGYVGLWRDGTIGWHMPTHLFPDKRFVHRPYQHDCIDPEMKFYVCEIVVKPVRDKLGRPIMRKAGTLGIAK